MGTECVDLGKTDCSRAVQGGTAQFADAHHFCNRYRFSSCACFGACVRVRVCDACASEERPLPRWYLCVFLYAVLITTTYARYVSDESTLQMIAHARLGRAGRRHNLDAGFKILSGALAAMAPGHRWSRFPIVCAVVVDVVV